MSAAQIYGVQQMSTLFYLPLSIAAFEKLDQLQVIMSSNILYDQNDEWVYY
jgi:hypothetical protein